jgi:hypothetical protein
MDESTTTRCTPLATTRSTASFGAIDDDERRIPIPRSNEVEPITSLTAT